MLEKKKIRIAFWGTPDFATIVLDALHAAGLTPELVVTMPDKPVGRKQIVTPPPVKQWAVAHGVAVDQPASLKEYTPAGMWDLFVLVAYGKLIPKKILDLPRYGTLNTHPSLLPKFRGASPVQSTILAGVPETGVSVMLLDSEMDHGPILQQISYTVKPGEKHEELRRALFELGGAALAKIIPEWISGSITTREQNHEEATFTEKFETKDGMIDFKTMSPEEIDRRVRALNPDPGTFTFFDIAGPASGRASKKKRVKILETDLIEGVLVIKKVHPEGKTPMTWESFQKRHRIVF